MVDWNIGNTCSLKCGYCHADFHRGNNPFPDLDKAKIIVNRIAERHRGSNRAVRFSLIGGEPTEWEYLPDLLAHIKDCGFISEIKTNGIAPYAVWDRIATVLTSVAITHHSSKTSYESLVDVCARLRNHGINLSVSFPIQPDDFEQVFERRVRFQSAFPDASSTLELLYSDYPRRHILMSYSAAQIARVHGPGDIDPDHIVIDDDGGISERHLGDILATGDNRCAGMLCRIGADQIVIDQDGSIRRGWCRVGGLLGTVQAGDFHKPTDAVVCTRARCNNPLDFSVVKYAQSEAY
jgi:organic radical activating enzyme